MAKGILILTGGPKKKLDAFDAESKQLNFAVTTASFYDIEYILVPDSKNYTLSIQGKDMAEYGLIYIRMVGKRLEDATLVVNYAREKGIRIIDRVYETSLFIPSSISKAVEMQKLSQSGIPLPSTFFGRLSEIEKKAPSLLQFPYVIKSTSGKKAKDAWLIKSASDFEEIYDQLRQREKEGVRFFAQKMIKASQRARVLVVGGVVIGAITRPTKWRKSFIEKQNGEYPEGKREAMMPVPEKYSELAIKSSNAANLDIAGIDILEEDSSGNLFVIEANAAPSWKLIAKDCGVNVEKEILTYLKTALLE